MQGRVREGRTRVIQGEVKDARKGEGVLSVNEGRRTRERGNLTEREGGNSQGRERHGGEEECGMDWIAERKCDSKNGRKGAKRVERRLIKT